MKIIKYQKKKSNIYQIITSKGTYDLYDDIIIKYELLLKNEIGDKEFSKIILENNMLKAYYESLKLISTRLKTSKEIQEYLIKKGYEKTEINYALKKLKENNYLNSKVYIEAYIHDMLNFHLVGEQQILINLQKLGFKEIEIKPFLNKIDQNIYQEKINKYLTKKLKSNKKSANEFKRKMLNELLTKGFNKSDIEKSLANFEIEDNKEELKKIINKLYQKYISKYDLYTTKQKIILFLYQKGYRDISLDDYLEQ